MAELGASSAAAAFLKPPAAVLAGIVAGALVVFAIELLEFHLTIDDPGGAISVHAIAGLWGLLSVALLSDAGGGSSGQWLAQLIGIATLLGLVLPLPHGPDGLIDRLTPPPADAGGRRPGIDTSPH